MLDGYETSTNTFVRVHSTMCIAYARKRMCKTRMCTMTFFFILVSVQIFSADSLCMYDVCVRVYSHFECKKHRIKVILVNKTTDRIIISEFKLHSTVLVERRFFFLFSSIKLHVNVCVCVRLKNNDNALYVT